MSDDPFGGYTGPIRDDAPDETHLNITRPDAELQRLAALTAPEPEAAPPPAPAPQGAPVTQPVDPRYHQWLQEQEAAAAQQQMEQFEEFAEEDPLGAMNYLAEAYAEHVRGEMQTEIDRRLAPLMQEHAATGAQGIVGGLEAEFGREVVELHGPRLAASLDAHAAAFVGPDGQIDSEKATAHLRTVLTAAEYERQLALAQGVDVKGAIRQAGMFRDEPPPERTIHVEGGGTPQAPPPGPVRQDVDPVIAAIRATEGRSDLFGKGAGRRR